MSSSGAPRFERVAELFARVCDLDLDEQAAELDRACEGDVELRAAVEELLREDAQAVQPIDRALREGQPFLPETTGTEGALARFVDDRRLPARIGAYEIRSELGRGGMGVVYEARQRTPRRSVALKLIRPGAGFGELLQRFRREAEVLGSLNHPGIAQVYEAGTAETPHGEQPFIAMELVRGLTVDRYVRDEQLGHEQVLELLVALAEAVHHAHGRGVVHRDLKPGNVLVTGDGQPKVLDFGVARAVRPEASAGPGPEQTGAEGTQHTRTGQLVGTLAYMSPEQVRGDSGQIDARTDVYALGAIAYELLGGARPLPLDSQSLPEAARAIVEDEPLPLGRLDRRLRGDVEVIVGKAMAKERRRRYATAAAFAEDLRRHLAGEPIGARPPSRIYQLSRFARRNKALVGGLAAAFGAMALGTAVATWQMGVAKRARRAADAERAVAAVEAYRGTLAAAQGGLEAGNVATAARALERIPPVQRGWEWSHLDARVEAAVAGVDRVAAASALDAERRLVLVETSAGAGDPDGNRARVAWYDPRLRDEAAELAAVTLPVDGVVRTALSADGRRVAAVHAGVPGGGAPVLDAAADAGEGKLQVSLWSLDPRRDLLRIRGAHLPAEPLHLALSRDGEVLAVTTAEATLAWNGERDPVVWPHAEPPLALVLNATGTHAGVLMERGGVHSVDLLELATGRTAEGLGRDVQSLAISPDARLLATGERDGVVRLRAAESGRVLGRLRAAQSGVGPVAFDADGLRLVAGGTGGGLGVFELDSPRPDRVRTPDWVLAERPQPLRALRFGPDRFTVVSRGEDGFSRVHDIRAASGANRLIGHAAPTVALAAAPDGATLVSASEDGTLRFWDTASQLCFASVPSVPIDAVPLDAELSAAQGRPARALAISPDGSLLASAHGARVLLRSSSDPLRTWALPGTIGGPVRALRFDPQGARLAVLDGTGTTQLFYLGEGGAVEPRGTGFGGGAPERPAGPDAGLEPAPLAFSDTGARLATLAGDEVVVLSTGSPASLDQRRLPRPAGDTRPTSALWLDRARFGDVLACGWSDGRVRLYDLERGEVDELACSAGVLSMVLLQDGERLAVGTAAGRIEVWDLVTRRLTLELQVGPHAVPLLVAVDASPGTDGAGSFLAVGVGPAIRLFDTVPVRVRQTSAAGLGQARERLQAPVLALLERSADPLHLTAALFADPDLTDAERRAALTWSLDPPLPDSGAVGDPFEGRALRFAGGDQHVSVGTSEALRMGESFTLEAWIRPAAAAATGLQIVAAREGEYLIGLWPGGELRWIVAGPDGWLDWVGARYAPPAGRWTHVALVREGAELRFHVNGRLVQTRVGPEAIGDHHPGMNELRIGGRQHTAAGFVGDIDEVRVWSRARSADELRAGLLRPLAGANEALPEGLVAAWSFDEPEGEPAADAGGRFPGQLVGATRCATR